ncbi:MAG: phosphodiester glycosidase family protein [Deltaproteobacteria bacterium]|nr:phosphodiester glycosidase family protein [Deltaproteobacteria bacterium]
MNAARLLVVLGCILSVGFARADPAAPLVERVAAPFPPPVAVGDGKVTVVRIDPREHPLRLLTALTHGGARTAPEWARAFGLRGVANAGMFLVGGRSVGLMVSASGINQPRVSPRYGAFLAFDPAEASDPPVAMFGRGCAGFDLSAIRARYRAVVQSIALLDCAGRPIPTGGRRAYSASAIGLDRAGRVAFVHVRTPFTMAMFRRILASSAVGLVSAMYLEGGPEASLWVRGERETVAEMGSFESGFFESDENRRFWEIPNVIGF